MTLAERLDKAIKAKGTSAYKVGQDTNISRALIGKYLKGTEPSVNNILLLADYLDVPLDWLIRGEGAMLKSEQDNKEVESKLNESDLVAYLKEEIEKLQIENKRLMKQNTYYELLLDNSGINYKQTAS